VSAKNVIGVLLILFGCISLGYAGINYTRRETVFKVGDLTATADKHENIPLNPTVGAVALAAGVAVMVLGRGRRTA
jgi:hypothetical protein